MRITTYDVEINEAGLNQLVKEKGTNYPAESLSNPYDIAKMFRDVFGLHKKAEEYVYMLAVNENMQPVAVFMLSKGTINYSCMHSREIFVRLLLCGTRNFVLIHNHPGKTPTPSRMDIETTNTVKKGADILGLCLLNHIIISDGEYSFKENGLL